MKVRIRDTLRVYWQEVRRYKPLLGFVLVTRWTGTILQLVTPLYYKRFFDTASGAIPSDVVSRELLAIILIIFVLNLLIWAAFRGTEFANSKFISRIMTDLAERAFDSLMGHSYGFFANAFGGALTQKLRRFARAFEHFFNAVLWDLSGLAIQIVVVEFVLWQFNHTVTFILLVWTVVFMVVNYIFSIWKLKYDRERAVKDSETTAVLADAITNHTNIQMFTGFSFESARFCEVAESFRRIFRFTWNLNSIINAVQALLFVAVEFLLFYFAIRFWGQGLITVGTFVLIQAYLLGLIHHLWNFGQVIREIYESFADAEEMVSIMMMPHEVQDVPVAKPLLVTGGRIEFKKVRFSFHKTRDVLHGINFVIAPGEKVALIGPSGAGKSTLVKLLFRFYDVDDGKILIDGQNIIRVTQESLWAHLSLVPQDPMLFHRTLLENIRYGRRDATDEEIFRAAKLAHCHEFIEELPQKYETFVGERGIKLSGGERQRVAIARAILKNAPILVLDEATSSLDSESERFIQDALTTLMVGKTTIVIAHRLSTIKRMDRIVVLDKGRIVEEGRHEKLVRNSKSLYQRLWKFQVGGFIGDDAG